MEALLLFLDVGLLIAVFVWAIRNADAKGPTTGLFRYQEQPPSRPASGQKRAAPWRRSR